MSSSTVLAQSGYYADVIRATRPPVDSPEGTMAWMFLLAGVVVVLGLAFIWAKFVQAPRASKPVCSDDCPELDGLLLRIDRVETSMAAGFRETHNRIDTLMTEMLRIAGRKQ